MTHRPAVPSSVRSDTQSALTKIRRVKLQESNKEVGGWSLEVETNEYVNEFILPPLIYTYNIDIEKLEEKSDVGSIHNRR